MAESFAPISRVEVCDEFHSNEHTYRHGRHTIVVRYVARVRSSSSPTVRVAQTRPSRGRRRAPPASTLGTNSAPWANNLPFAALCTDHQEQSDLLRLHSVLACRHAYLLKHFEFKCTCPVCKELEIDDGGMSFLWMKS
eukprot:3844676-Amphidinium_carterae.1